MSCSTYMWMKSLHNSMDGWSNVMELGWLNYKTEPSLLMTTKWTSTELLKSEQQVGSTECSSRNLVWKNLRSTNFTYWSQLLQRLLQSFFSRYRESSIILSLLSNSETYFSTLVESHLLHQVLRFSIRRYEQTWRMEVWNVERLDSLKKTNSKREV